MLHYERKRGRRDKTAAQSDVGTMTGTLLSDFVLGIIAKVHARIEETKNSGRDRPIDLWIDQAQGAPDEQPFRSERREK